MIPKSFFLKAFLGILAALTFSFWFLALNARKNQGFILRFYDVGQGDSIFVQSPSKAQMLVDGGPSPKVVEYLGEDLPFNDKDLDVVVLTHPHADHLSGLIDVLRSYEVALVLADPVVLESSLYDEWKALLAEEKVAVREVYRGDQLHLGEVEVEVLWPLSREFIVAAADPNETSIILRLSYGNFSALLTGDAEEALKTMAVLPVVLLKIPHHGSGGSVDAALLDRLKPQLLVISVGKNNKYGLPSSQVLGVADAKGLQTLRTDQKGTVVVRSDGHKWWLTGS